MINILLISSTDDHAKRIAALIAESGISNELRIVHGAAKQLRSHAEDIRHADLLIIDDTNLDAGDLASVEEAISHHPRLNCMLITTSQSNDLMMGAMRAGVRHMLHWPLDTHEFAVELSHVAGRKASGTRRTGRVVSFTSCKGGSGTTFIAVNFAHTLAQLRDKRVLLIDLNQQFADAGLYIADKLPSATLFDLCAQIERLDSALFDACVMHVNPNFDVLAGAGDPVKAGELRAVHLERVLELVRAQYDVIVVDIGQSVSPLSIQALDQSDAICMVVRQNVLYLHTARRMLDLFNALGYAANKVRVIANQYDKHAQVSLQMIEEMLGVRAIHPLPRDDKSVAAALNQGVALRDVVKSGGLAEGIEKLVELVFPAPPATAQSMLRRIFASKNGAVPQMKAEH
ncbi:MAG TPA: AAA family ATPase [Pararobbsia sp.]|nr:AAA family ATPase [Pararobbsia sp.]